MTPYRTADPPAQFRHEPAAELRFIGNGVYELRVFGREAAVVKLFAHEADLLEHTLRELRT